MNMSRRVSVALIVLCIGMAYSADFSESSRCLCTEKTDRSLVRNRVPGDLADLEIEGVNTYLKSVAQRLTVVVHEQLQIYSTLVLAEGSLYSLASEFVHGRVAIGAGRAAPLCPSWEDEELERYVSTVWRNWKEVSSDMGVRTTFKLVLKVLDLQLVRPNDRRFWQTLLQTSLAESLWKELRAVHEGLKRFSVGNSDTVLLPEIQVFEDLEADRMNWCAPRDALRDAVYNASHDLNRAVDWRRYGNRVVTADDQTNELEQVVDSLIRGQIRLTSQEQSSFFLFAEKLSDMVLARNLRQSKESRSPRRPPNPLYVRALFKLAALAGRLDFSLDRDVDGFAKTLSHLEAKWELVLEIAGALAQNLTAYHVATELTSGSLRLEPEVEAAYGRFELILESAARGSVPWAAGRATLKFFWLLTHRLVPYENELYVLGKLFDRLKQVKSGSGQSKQGPRDANWVSWAQEAMMSLEARDRGSSMYASRRATETALSQMQQHVPLDQRIRDTFSLINAWITAPEQLELRPSQFGDEATRLNEFLAGATFAAQNGSGREYISYLWFHDVFKARLDQLGLVTDDGPSHFETTNACMLLIEAFSLKSKGFEKSLPFRDEWQRILTAIPRGLLEAMLDLAEEILRAWRDHSSNSSIASIRP